MQLTARQQQILKGVVEEYSRTASPVSSQALEERHMFGLSSATLRNEMAYLTEQGYLSQPHISAGRIPADKGYRFYVNELLNAQDWKKEKPERKQEAASDEIVYIQEVTRNLALATSALALAYVNSRHLFWKEGWEAMVHAPEFEEREYRDNLFRLLHDVEHTIPQLEQLPELVIYIGKENPFSRIQDFSMLIGQTALSQSEKGVLVLIGPKRMAYSSILDRFYSLLD